MIDETAKSVDQSWLHLHDEGSDKNAKSEDIIRFGQGQLDCLIYACKKKMLPIVFELFD